MRRASLSTGLLQGAGEPLIVVEESGGTDDEEGSSRGESPNPGDAYLLSPWREPARKHSLPTPSCTSGITASQVRRLSERGGEAAQSAREAAFLATLSSAPAPAPGPGGRRHSVVTISRVPPSLFGRNRRESIAAFPALGSRTVLASGTSSRRESVGCVPPVSAEHRGSMHSLQLDIMDDIVAARKVRMKMWTTSNERVCEVQPLDEVPGGGAPTRYTQQAGSSRADARRYSDFVGTTLPPIISSKRRASEYPTCLPSTSSNKENTGIVCSNTDLISILTSLTSSATEINLCGVSKTESTTKPNAEQKRSRMKNSRSNSFDVSILHGVYQGEDSSEKAINDSLSSWFIKRHQPMSKKNEEKKVATVTFMDEKLKKFEKQSKDEGNKNNAKVVWDERSGSVVDAEALGVAIEGFLRKGGPPESPSPQSPSKAVITKPAAKTAGKSSTNVKISSPSTWFSSKNNEEDATESCDTSLCSTLKDLFVK